MISLSIQEGGGGEEEEEEENKVLDLDEFPVSIV
jgi:hypothetical protein